MYIEREMYSYIHITIYIYIYMYKDITRTLTKLFIPFVGMTLLNLLPLKLQPVKDLYTQFRKGKL